jgi:hypothetical protein
LPSNWAFRTAPLSGRMTEATLRQCAQRLRMVSCRNEAGTHAWSRKCSRAFGRHFEVDSPPQELPRRSAAAYRLSIGFERNYSPKSLTKRGQQVNGAFIFSYFTGGIYKVENQADIVHADRDHPKRSWDPVKMRAAPCAVQSLARRPSDGAIYGRSTCPSNEGFRLVLIQLEIRV